MRGKLLYIFFIIPIVTLGFVVNIFHIRIGESSLSFAVLANIIFFVLSLIGNILLYYFLEQYSIMTQEAEQKKELIEKYKIQMKYYERKEKINKKNDEFIHNINHYLKAIGNYAELNQGEKIKNLLDELQVEFFSVVGRELSENILLNTILNDYVEIAKVKRIPIDIAVEPYFDLDFIKEIDMIAIMRNLLDNAIEAAEKCENRWIKVRLLMRNNRNFSVICMDNTYTGTIKKVNNKIITTKKEKGRHGIGMTNVRNTVERYGGVFCKEYDGKVFRNSIIFPVTYNKR